MSDLNREKRAEIIQDALEYLDDDMIENVDKLRMGTKAPVRNAERIKEIFANSSHNLTVAASVCLLLIGAFAWGNVIGPSHSQDAPMGNEVPEMGEDFEEETEVKSEQPGEESDAIINGTELESEATPNPPMGDAYQLVDNYVKVTMLPNKAWASEETIKDNYAQSQEIEAKYYEIINKFVEALCDTPCLSTDMVMDTGKPVEDIDVYHIFFQRTDGEIVQVCIFVEYNFVYFYHNPDYGMKINEDILDEMLKVLWVDTYGVRKG